MARSSLCSTLLSFALLVSALGGCAKLEDRARYYLSSSATVYAVVGGRLLQGEAQLYSDRTATLSADTGLSVAPAVHCAGRMRRTGTTAANVDLRCSDGTEMSIPVVMLAEAQGYGLSPNGAAPAASLTFGLEPAKAVAYLRAPAGQQIVTLPQKPFIEMR